MKTIKNSPCKIKNKIIMEWDLNNYLPPAECFDDGTDGSNLNGVVLGEAEEVGAPEGGEGGAGGGEAEDGDMSLLAELDQEVGLH